MMGGGGFTRGVVANLIASALFALLVWWVISARGGVCPMCGHRHDAGMVGG